MNIKYEKGIYEAKINELEGYCALLQTHLTTLENYKSQMFAFWDDERARKTGEILTEQVRSVRTVMNQANLELLSLKNTVDKMTAVETKQDQELDNTFRALQVAAEYIPG